MASDSHHFRFSCGELTGGKSVVAATPNGMVANHGERAMTQKLISTNHIPVVSTVHHTPVVSTIHHVPVVSTIRHERLASPAH
jgi:hypothetical protein